MITVLWRTTEHMGKGKLISNGGKDEPDLVRRKESFLVLIHLELLSLYVECILEITHLKLGFKSGSVDIDNA